MEIKTALLPISPNFVRIESKSINDVQLIDKDDLLETFQNSNKKQLNQSQNNSKIKKTDNKECSILDIILAQWGIPIKKIKQKISKMKVNQNLLNKIQLLLNLFNRQERIVYHIQKNNLLKNSEKKYNNELKKNKQDQLVTIKKTIIPQLEQIENQNNYQVDKQVQRVLKEKNICWLLIINSKIQPFIKKYYIQEQKLNLKKQEYPNNCNNNQEQKQIQIMGKTTIWYRLHLSSQDYQNKLNEWLQKQNICPNIVQKLLN